MLSHKNLKGSKKNLKFNKDIPGVNGLTNVLNPKKISNQNQRFCKILSNPFQSQLKFTSFNSYHIKS